MDINIIYITSLCLNVIAVHGVYPLNMICYNNYF